MMDIGPYYKQPGYCNWEYFVSSYKANTALERLAQQALRQGVKCYSQTEAAVPVHKDDVCQSVRAHSFSAKTTVLLHYLLFFITQKLVTSDTHS